MSDKQDDIVLSIRGMSKTFGRNRVLDHIDLDVRRGTVMGMNAEGGMQTVEAEVPMAEMSSYAIDLRSMTQGRGSFTLEFSRYSEAPAAVQQKIIDEAKANADE